MLPTTLKSQIDRLAGELASCIDLCIEIRQTQKFAATPTHLNRLETAFVNSSNNIPTALKTARKRAGSWVETGDSIAIKEMDDHIQDLVTIVTPKLQSLARPIMGRKEKHPGFSKLAERWAVIERGVEDTIESQAIRLESALPKPKVKRQVPGPTTAAPRVVPVYATAEPMPPKSNNFEEVTISRKELDQLLDMRRNCWEEVLEGGRIMYVNCYNRDKQTWDRPVGAFIKDYQRVAKTPAFQRRASRGL